MSLSREMPRAKAEIRPRDAAGLSAGTMCPAPRIMTSVRFPATLWYLKENDQIFIECLFQTPEFTRKVPSSYFVITYFVFSSYVPSTRKYLCFFCI